MSAWPGCARRRRGDAGRDLATGQLATLAGLAALGDLDLELLGAGEVGGGDPEARRGDLLDARVVAHAVRSRHVPGRILATLAGVRGAAGALDAERHAWCASGLSAPTLMAEATNRRAIALAGSTSSSRRARRAAGARGAGRAPARDGAPGRPDRPRAARRDPCAACRRALRPRRGPGAPARCAARTGAAHRRPGSGQSRDRAPHLSGGQHATGRRPRASRSRIRRDVARRSWRSARSTNPTRPGQAAARPGSSGPRTAGSSSTSRRARRRCTTAAALMPARASVLRSPASRASSRLPAPHPRGPASSAPRPPANSAASLDGQPWRDDAGPRREGHRGGMDVQDVRGLDDEIRPAAQTRPVSAVWTAPTARTEGTGRRRRRSPGRRGRPARAPRRAACTAASARRSRAASRACGPSAARQWQATRWTRRGGPEAGRAKASHQRSQVGHERSSRRSGARARRRAAEQRRAPAQLHAQVQDDALALRIDGRVGDLGERLAEVVGDGPVEPAERRASACRRPCSRAARGPRGPSCGCEPVALRVEAGQEARGPGRWPWCPAAAGRRLARVGVVGGARRGAAAAGARGPWRRASSRIRPRAGLHEEQLARAEPPAAHDLGGREGHRAGLRRDAPRGPRRSPRRPPGAGRCGRASAPTGATVAEDERRRPVPRREQARRSGAVARPPPGAAIDPQPERLGDRGQQRRRQLPAAWPAAVSSASSSESESEPSGGEERPGSPARSRAAAPRPGRRARPRNCSRLPRTVLISPLWASGRKGCARRHVGLRVRRVALVEQREADAGGARRGPGTARPAGRPRQAPCRRPCGADAEAIESALAEPARAARVSPAVGARASRASKAAGAMPARRRATKACSMRGRARAASRPRTEASTGTRRQVEDRKPLSGQACSHQRPLRIGLSPARQEAAARCLDEPGRAIRRGARGATGRAAARTPAPSLDAPSAANAPR